MERSRYCAYGFGEDQLQYCLSKRSVLRLCLLNIVPSEKANIDSGSEKKGNLDIVSLDKDNQNSLRLEKGSMNMMALEKTVYKQSTCCAFRER